MSDGSSTFGLLGLLLTAFWLAVLFVPQRRPRWRWGFLGRGPTMSRAGRAAWLFAFASLALAGFVPTVGLPCLFASLIVLTLVAARDSRSRS